MKEIYIIFGASEFFLFFYKNIDNLVSYIAFQISMKKLPYDLESNIKINLIKDKKYYFSNCEMDAD